MVYNPSAVKWLIDFFVKPFQTTDPSFRAAARQGYNAMKQRTKQELLKNWEQILQGHLVNYFDCIRKVFCNLKLLFIY